MSLSIGIMSSSASVKRREEIEAKKRKLEELRQARIARQQAEAERRANPEVCKLVIYYICTVVTNLHLPLPLLRLGRRPYDMLILMILLILH